jgi:hypothetical protein
MIHKRLFYSNLTVDEMVMLKHNLRTFLTSERKNAMQTAKQLSVTLVNKPGRLADMLTALSKEKVLLTALSVMDSGVRGTVRFIPDDLRRAQRVLDQINVPYDTTEVLLAEIPNQPGGFAHFCERLATYHLNIDYAYCSFDLRGKSKGCVLGVFKVNDLAKAEQIIAGNGFVRKKRIPIRRPMKLSTRT